jgi:phenylpropionate dioxygenase-like ring-hydroxylating dioxygenase large terminal subunit
MGSPSEPVIWPDDGVSAVPYRIYTDPAVCEAERAHIFRGPVWSFVALETEIAAPGDYKTIYIGDTPVVAIRDNAGAINVLVNRCAHRGNLVCTRKSGNAERLTCVYHNWIYDLDGSLQSVAFRRGINGHGGMADDFDMAGHAMTRLRVARYAGLVFASFDEAAPSIEAYLGAEMCDNIDRVVGRDMVLLGTYSQYMTNNWKLYMENVRDSYHASLLHLFQATFRINRLSMKGGIKLSEGGQHHISYSIGATDREAAEYDADKLRSVNDGYRLADPSLIEGWPEYACGTTLAIQSVFPNFVVQQIYNVIALRLCLPKGPEHCELLWWVLGTAGDTEAERRMRLKQGNMIGPGGLISLEDGVVGGWVQRGTRGDLDMASLLEMGGRDVAPSREGRATEVSIRGFWQAYRDLMGM